MEPGKPPLISKRCKSVLLWGVRLRCFMLCRPSRAELFISEKWLQVNDQKPGWVATTRELKRLVDGGYGKAPQWAQGYWPFIEQMQVTIQALMTARRHKIDHVAGGLTILPGDFAPEIAADVIAATRSFLFRLADDLPRNIGLSAPQ